MTKKSSNAVKYANQLLDKLIKDLQLKNDAALCRALGISPPVLSKVRNGRVPFSAALIICVHEETGLAIKELKDILAHGVPGRDKLSGYRRIVASTSATL